MWEGWTISEWETAVILPIFCNALRNKTEATMRHKNVIVAYEEVG